MPAVVEGIAAGRTWWCGLASLLGLVKRWGPERVDLACASALEHETVNVALIGRILERAGEGAETPAVTATPVVTGRFARGPDEFATTPATGTEGRP